MSSEKAGDTSDQTLLRRVAAGDEDALRGLYAAYGQRLYAYALRLSANPAAAEDVLAESLLAVWQNAKKFRGEGRVVAWLLSIVHNKALNVLRQRPPYALPEDIAEPVSTEPGPDEHAAAGARRHLLKTGLAQLSPEHRTALELVFYQGLSLNEAAAVCRCPVGTIKSRLNYAKQHLRGWLSRQGISAEDWL